MVADPYEILQVSPTAHLDVIKAAYRALTRQVDFNQTPEERKVWYEGISKAHALINTEEKREAYDAEQQERVDRTFKPGRVDGEVLGALLAIIDGLLEMDGSITASSLREEMIKDGYSNLDFLLAVKALVAKDLVEKVSVGDANGPVPAYRLTDDAWEWVEAKRSTFPPRPSKERSVEQPAPLPVSDSDSPHIGNDEFDIDSCDPSFDDGCVMVIPPDHGHNALHR